MTTEQEATRLAAHLLTAGSRLVAHDTTRNVRFGVWVVSLASPAPAVQPVEGGGLVVTDDEGVYELDSATGSLDDLMIVLGLWPGAEPSAVFNTAGDVIPLASQQAGEVTDLDTFRRALSSRSDSNPAH